MDQTKSRVKLPTRRQVLSGGVIALGGLFLDARVRGGSRQSTTGSGAVKDTRTSLHQEIDFHASSRRIYETLLDSKEFAAFSGEPADIHGEAGGSFSMFGGKITGRNVELIPNERIVQAWRSAAWNPGVYSIVRFEITGQGSQARLVLDHAGFPEGQFEHLDPGWKAKYWDPLKKFIG
jgi:activator of HSP90 ATPase